MYVIVPAAGVGARFSTDLPKQYLKINHKTILDHTIDALFQHSKIQYVVVALHPEDTHFCDSIFYQSKQVVTVMGGATRAHSVLNGLYYLQDQVVPDDWVLVHDACRPYVSLEELSRLLMLCEEYHPIGGLLASPVTDTLKIVSDAHDVMQTLARDHVWRAQTPQLFRYGILKKALESSLQQNNIVTDESSAVEQLGLHPKIIQGSTRNIKITYPEDLSLNGNDT